MSQISKFSHKYIKLNIFEQIKVECYSEVNERKVKTLKI